MIKIFSKDFVSKLHKLIKQNTQALESRGRKFKVNNLDNVKGPSVVTIPQHWNIASGPRAQLRIYHSRLLTDLARNSSLPSQLNIEKGPEGSFHLATIHERTSSTRSGGAGKSFPDKCAVLVLMASREGGYPFPARRPQLVLPSLFPDEPTVSRIDRSMGNLWEKLSSLKE